MCARASIRLACFAGTCQILVSVIDAVVAGKEMSSGVVNLFVVCGVFLSECY